MLGKPLVSWAFDGLAFVWRAYPRQVEPFVPAVQAA